MASDAAKTLQGEASEASTKFEAEFDFSKMDRMIHRFPPVLGETISSRYPYMVVPTFVAIGPYHHGKKHLEKMEAVKKAAAYYLWQRSKTLKLAVENATAHYNKSSEKPALDHATMEVVNAVNEARGLYFADESVKEQEEGMNLMKDAAQFADMMICDASFLLLYMDAYRRSYGKDVGQGQHDDDESMRRFLFCHRDRINNDIMLLENQLPWVVIRALMRRASNLELELKKAVGHFVAAMGSSFKIRDSSNLEPYVWDDENNPPPHLLALLRRHKTQEPDKIANSASAQPEGSSTSTSVVVNVGNSSNNHLSPPSDSVHQPLIHQDPTPQPQPPSTQAGNRQEVTQAGNRQEVLVSAISLMELEQIGIKLTADPTAKFSDMSLDKGLLWSRLKQVPLSLGDTSCLVNMAAFEVCTTSRFGDPPCKTAVCSYLALLAFFMVGSEDVRKLRSMGLLHGPNRDDDMLAFFEALKKHLPVYGANFAKVMADVLEYKQKRSIRTTLYSGVYKYWKTIGTVMSIILAAGTAIVGLINMYQELLALIHNN